MGEIGNLLESLSSLLWPLIVIVVIILFLPAVRALIESAKSRKFTLKIGGQELTMEEANEQQRTLIADLQGQFAELRKTVERIPQPTLAKGEEPLIAEFTHPSILWVDDYPKNNSYFIEQLGDRGISVDLALSTEEGLAKFKTGAYLYIISDMGRREDGKEKPEAGIELLTEVRKINSQIPFFFFCSSRGVQQAGDKARQLGVTGITSSPVELFGMLSLERIKKRI